MSYARHNAMELKWSAFFTGFWSVEYQLPERFLCVQLGWLQKCCGARERSEFGNWRLLSCGSNGDDFAYVLLRFSLLVRRVAPTTHAHHTLIRMVFRTSTL